MISGRDFLVLSDDWNGLPNSTKHLFQHILPQNRVFWWNVINRLPRWSWNDVKKVAGVLGQWVRHGSPGRQRLGACAAPSPDAPCFSTPFFIPWFKPAVRRVNRASLSRAFRRLGGRYGIRDPIIFTTLPSTVDFVKSAGAARKIYYCVDEWTQYPGLSPAHWKAMEEELIDCVDGFVATSRDLEKKGQRCLATLYLPHGVDFEHFHRDKEALEPVPELEALPRPIVGFFGLIAEWIDLERIAALSRAFPRLSFVLIGKSVVSMECLSGRENVHYLGPMPYAELPRYARYFDVGLIPFLRNKLTEAVNPLKLLEYYALGLPVLATRLPELEAAVGPIHLASSEAEFREGLEKALSNPNSDAEAAIAVARGNTWRQRAEKLSGFLEGLT
jgi:glycosyltransferase involved in cell wall biosynthesis